ncbi:hypothetical protein Egran_04621 [Elaphomyces granulatus]|uniref:Uncharacterized protein n=1 Tax=Elaphomyces granulatus TaxID=519963 RepID=A0A232LU55_9EURO|nr:hypothetical protein Egran_04621 [Elaphomyces granulatus]
MKGGSCRARRQPECDEAVVPTRAEGEGDSKLQTLFSSSKGKCVAGFGCRLTVRAISFARSILWLAIRSTR